MLVSHKLCGYCEVIEKRKHSFLLWLTITPSLCVFLITFFLRLVKHSQPMQLTLQSLPYNLWEYILPLPDLSTRGKMLPIYFSGIKTQFIPWRHCTKRCTQTICRTLGERWKAFESFELFSIPLEQRKILVEFKRKSKHSSNVIACFIAFEEVWVYFIFHWNLPMESKRSPPTASYILTRTMRHGGLA